MLEGLDLLSRRLQTLLQRTAAMKRALASAGTHSHPVLSDPVHFHQPGVQQGGNDLREQLVPLLAPLRAEIGQHVIVDAHTAAQPLVRQTLLTQPGEFASAADSLQCGKDPQPDQQAGVGGIAADVSLDGLDLAEPGLQIEREMAAQTTRTGWSASSKSSSDAQRSSI